MKKELILQECESNEKDKRIVIDELPVQYSKDIREALDKYEEYFEDGKLKQDKKK